MSSPHWISPINKENTFLNCTLAANYWSLHGCTCRNWQKLRTLNYFPSVPPTLDPYKLKSQVITTYATFILFLISLVILISYLSMISVTKTEIVKSPTLKQYLKLYAIYSQKLTCPCKSIAIEHKVFMKVTYTLHQVCSSNFITEDWMDFVSRYEYTLPNINRDFRKSASYMFQSLQLICKQVNGTITYHLSSFYDTRYVAFDLTPFKTFEYRTKSIFNQFHQSMVNEFLSSLNLVRNMIQVNALFSSLQSNARIVYENIAYVSLRTLTYVTTNNEGL